MKSSTVRPHGFVLGAPKPRPSCWKNTVALDVGRSRSSGVYVGDVKSLVEEVDGENHLYGPRT